MTFLNSIFNFSCLADVSNYASWATNIKFILMNKDLWAVVSGTSFKPVVELDDVNTLNLKFLPEYIIWSKKNNRTCATIALSCQNGFKGFIQDLSACQMWLKLKKLYEVQGFNARYLTFMTLLSHHYNLSKFIEDYVDQLKTLSQCLQEMNSTFSDWVILTVLLNNLEFTFNVFVTAKHQFICVTTFTFNFLAAELIDEARMKNNKSSVAMTFCGKPKLTSSLLQCSHCKKTDHEKPMCFAKYPHKKKKLNAAWAAKKKGKLLSSDKFSGKFFNNIKSIFNKTDDNATTLSFMSVIGSHLMSVWIVDTEASDHLCSIHKFFLTYEPISRSLKTVNESAQIIEKNMVSLCLVCSDGGIQEVILKDIMHASDSSANLVFDCCMRADDIFFDMCDCTLRHKNNVIEYASEVNRIFQLHLDNTPQSHAFAANCGFKVSFDMWHWRLSHLGHTNIKCLSKIINSIDLKDLP